MWGKSGNFITYSSDIALLSTYSKIVPMNMGRSTLIAVSLTYEEKQITLAAT